MSPPEKGVYYISKEICSEKVRFSLLEDPFSEGIGVQYRKQEVTKVVSLGENGDKISGCTYIFRSRLI